MYMSGRTNVKRSEMILALQRFYHIRHGMVEHNYITPDQFMSEILDYIEHRGMLPPFVDDPQAGFSSADYVTMHFDQAVYAGTCKWESEDETK